MGMRSYYDIDSILAEEEHISCTTLFDFSHLGYLDPDYVPNVSRRAKQNSFLAENTRIKLPLWSIKKWAKLGFVRLSVPRHFGRKARERLATDPGSADLRTKNERYFSSGLCLVNLIQECGNILPAKANTSNRIRRRLHINAMKELLQEATALRETLLVTFTGERLRRTFDWTLGSTEDDVSMFTRRLTEMELNLFLLGASASHAHQEWKNFGSRKIPVCTALSSTKQQFTPSTGSFPNEVTPDKKIDEEQKRKRKRIFDQVS